MIFNDIKQKKERQKEDYLNNLKEERKIPDEEILQHPEEAFIPPIDIQEYKWKIFYIL